MFDVSHIHPMLVHFPIALLCFGFFLELCYLVRRKYICLTAAGLYLLLGGTLATVLTVLSGFFFTGEMSGAAGAVREIHGTFAVATAVVALLASGLRLYLARKKVEKSPLMTVAFLLYGLAALGVMGAGFYGGTLVYNHMMPL